MPYDPDFGWTVTGSTPRTDGNTDFVNVKGSVFVPRDFKVRAEMTHKHGEPIDVGWWVELECKTLNGREVKVEALKVVAPIWDERYPGVTHYDLRHIPINRLAKWGLRAIAVERTEEGAWQLAIDERTKGRVHFLGWMERAREELVERAGLDLWEIDSETEERLEASFGAAKADRAGRRPTRDEAFWKKIEDAYLKAVENREPTIDAVQKVMGPHYERRYVQNLISEARKRGHDLPKRGRVK